MKVCTKCKKQKKETDFYIDKRTKSGLYARCKPCHGVFDEKAREIRKQSAKPKVNKWTKEYINSYHKNYDSQPTEKPKVAARQAVSRAIIAGKLQRLPCTLCGEIKTDAHHEDYSKELEVVWYCRLHHKRRHLEMKIN